MILLLIESSQALCVYDDDWQLLVGVGVAVEDLSPDPEPFGARIDSWSNLEACRFGLLLLLVHTCLLLLAQVFKK